MTTPMAWDSVIRPELTKLMTIMSVAEELWTRRVTRIPMITATKRFAVARSRMERSLLPAASLRPEDIMLIPYRNSPMPPSSVKNSNTVIKKLLIHFTKAAGIVAQPCKRNEERYVKTK